MADEALDPTLTSIIDQHSLRWVYVGGKGGVGKTTTACSLAVQLAKVRKSVLLISTDPAHNLSDAFGQKFGKEATKVTGFDNLSAMEIDPQSSIEEMVQQSEAQGGAMGSIMQDMAFAIPGVDEAMGFAEIMKQVKSMEYDVVVFDTAPTGHTLRFLSFPSVLEKALAKFSTIGRSFGPMLNGILGNGGANQEDMFARLESMRSIINEVNTQFKDPVSGDAAKEISQRLTAMLPPTGKDNICLRVHCRIPLSIRDGEADPGADAIRDRHACDRMQPVAVPVPRVQLPTLLGTQVDARQVSGRNGGALCGRLPPRAHAAFDGRDSWRSQDQGLLRMSHT